MRYLPWNRSSWYAIGKSADLLFYLRSEVLGQINGIVEFSPLSDANGYLKLNIMINILHII